jgi:tetratricopeptide (TPR) repeat protein
MSLQTTAVRIVRSFRTIGAGQKTGHVPKTTKTTAANKSSLFSSKSFSYQLQQSKRYFATSKGGIDESSPFLAGNKEAVRAAYRSMKKSTGSGETPKKSSSGTPEKRESGDIMEDILNEALPNRKRSETPDLGDVDGLKRHLKSSQLAEGEISVNSARAQEAEDDRAWMKRMSGEEDEEYDGFGVDAPVKVPQEVFELNAQAQFCFLKEEYVEALDYLEQSMELIRSRLGEDHNEAATVMVSMAQVHEKLKNFDKSEKLLEQAVRIRKLSDGPVHTSVAVALNKLSHIQTCQRKFDEAIKTNKQAFRIIEAAQKQNAHELGYYTDHQMEIPVELDTVRRALQTELGQIMNTRGAIHFKNRELTQAIEDWNKAIEIWTPVLIETESVASPLFAVHRNLGHLHKQQNDVGATESVAKHFIALLERHQPKSALLPSAYLYLCQIYEHYSLLNDAHIAAQMALKSSIAINGRGEESDEIEEAVQVISQRLHRKLGIGEDKDELDS